MFEKVPCKYSTIGCEEEVERKDLAEHEGDTQQHLQLAVDTVHQLQGKVANLPSQHIQVPMKYIFTNYNQNRSSENKIYSPAFYTSQKGYKMCICVFANGYWDGKGTHVSVGAHLMKGENDDYLPWPFIGIVTVELFNQLEDENHHCEDILFRFDNEASQRVMNKERSDLAWGKPEYISHSDLGLNTAKNCQYLKNDRLHFRISVITRSSSTPWLI
jgi:TNF receptor-associated factor 4